MDTITQLVRQLEAENGFGLSANDNTLQFESDNQPLLFSSLLPEVTVESNSFRDHGIRFKTMVANDGTRYSPPQKKNAMLMASVQVELGDSDMAAELTMQAYEAFIKMLDRNLTQEAAANLLRYFRNGIAQPLALLRERHRVDAICDGYIVRRGANQFEETVHFSKPVGHRALIPSGTLAAKTGWYNPAHDILGTLKTYKRFLAKKGYTVTRIITTTEILSECLVKNDGIRVYGLARVVAANGTNVDLPTLSEDATVVAAFSAIGLPRIETYDLGYSDQNGYQLLMKERFIMVCSTGRSTEINLGDEAPLVIPNTIGYTAIGIATGQLISGVASKVEAFTGKDARIEMTGWQTSFPVIQEPEAFVVLTIPEPTA